MHHKKRLPTLAATALTLTLLSGCATVKKPTNPADPYENFNRQVFKFNMAVDDLIFSPITETYVTVVPQPIQTRISCFYGNIGEIPTVANDILQFKLVHALADSWRFVINSTVGIFGLFDVAGKIGLKKHREDFGLTLSRWGAKKSPYLMLPFLGPSTVRDAIGIPVNYYLFTIYPHVKSYPMRYGLISMDLIDTRANLLPAHRLIKKAFDPYVFVRNAYMQHRNSLINQDDANNNDQATTKIKSSQAIG